MIPLEIRNIFNSYQCVFSSMVTSLYENRWWSSKLNFTAEMYVEYLINYGNDELKNIYVEIKEDKKYGRKRFKFQ